MKKIEDKALKQTIYFEKLDNGLEIYIVPNEKRKGYFLNYFAKFGSLITEFTLDKKKIRVPYGVAHFLEHKLFEQENGADPFSFFMESGSDANASTSYKSTSYIVNGIDNLQANLDFLITFLNSPHFTDKNVLKEKNIIVEELKMYKDIPDSKITDTMLKMVFQRHPMRIDIGGTEKSVLKITKEDLYNCYNAFYQPSNIRLVITGNVNPEECLKTIKNNKALNSKKELNEVKIKRIVEKAEVFEKKKEIYVKGLAVPELSLVFKISIKDLNLDLGIDLRKYINLLFTTIYGSSSDFYERMLEKDYFSQFLISTFLIDDFILVELAAESKVPEKLYTEIEKEYKKVVITKETVERIKKVYISQNVKASDNITATSYRISSGLIDYNCLITDNIERIKAIEYEKILRLKKLIDIKNTSLLLSYPKKPLN